MKKLFWLSAALGLGLSLIWLNPWAAQSKDPKRLSRVVLTSPSSSGVKAFPKSLPLPIPPGMLLAQIASPTRPTTTTTTTRHDERVQNREELLSPTDRVTDTVPNSAMPAGKNSEETPLTPELQELVKSTDDDLHLRPLSLQNAIIAGIQSNFDVLVKIQNEKEAEGALRQARGEFDPTLTITGSYEHLRLPQNTQDFVATGGTPEDLLNRNPRVFQEENYHYKIALDAKTIIGTQIEAKTQFDDLQNTLNQTSPLALFSPEYQSFTGLTITQPFLRGFGAAVNGAAIKVALLDRLASQYDVQDQLISMISQVEQSYYQLIFLDFEYRAKKQDVSLGSRVVSQHLDALEKGQSSDREINRSESVLAEIVEDFTKTQNDILNQQAELQGLICNQPPTDIGFRYLPIGPMPTNFDLELNYGLLMQYALTHRPKYLSALQKVEEENIRLVYAKNQSWPQLDFNSTVGENGLASTYGNSYSREVSQQGPQYSVGFTFSVPFGNNAALGQVDQARAKKKEAVLTLAQIQLDTSLEIQKLINIIRSNKSRLQAMNLFVRTAEKGYDRETDRLEKGLSTELDVLRYSRDFSEARAHQAAALADLNKSYVQIKEVTGYLLAENHFTMLP